MALGKQTIKDISLKGRKVFCRVDFNVPISSEGQITETNRIDASLPTIRYLVEAGARVVLASHLGRPKGEWNPTLSLSPVAPYLAEQLGQAVAMAPDCVGLEVEDMVNGLQDGQVVLLENLRFHPGEEKNEPDFVTQLAKLGKIYVNDAFGTAHRAHASTVGVAEQLQPAVAGFLLEQELAYLGSAVENPQRPFVAVLGGAKVSDKIQVIRNLLPKVNQLVIGGGIAYTFLKAQGYEVGRSMVEEEQLELASQLQQQAQQQGVAIYLPSDHIIAKEFDAKAATGTCSNDDFPADWMALDIGPQTRESYSQLLQKARTVLWNGPMGVFEMVPFAEGTFAMARTLAACDNTSIVGGGDSVAAVYQAGVADKITHISTGGGASLEFLEGHTLPGVAALTAA